MLGAVSEAGVSLRASRGRFQYDILKRDGRHEAFTPEKIVGAVQRCLTEALRRPDGEAEEIGHQVARAVHNILKTKTEAASVEEIQQLVIQQLWALGHHEAGEAYTLYRIQRRKEREQQLAVADGAQVAEDATHFPTDLQYYQFVSKFARWREGDRRRETWRETVDRVIGWLRALPAGAVLTDTEWLALESALFGFEVSPAMRIVQMAGPALDRCHVGCYNCAFHPISDLFAFAELLYILMQGSGAGFSVETDYVGQLPRIKKQKKRVEAQHYVVDDSTEGWCEALHAGLQAWFNGLDIIYDYSNIRQAGARLKIKGGRAAGPEPLRQLLTFARTIILRNQGGYLSDLDVHDICCMIGKIVQVGGVRRASEISLSDLDSDLMRKAKFGDWYEKATWRTMANNSAVYNEKPDAVEFMEEWLSLAQSGSGERGIFNRHAINKTLPKRRKRVRFGINPSLRAGTRVYTTKGIVPIQELEGREFCIKNLNGGISRAKCWLSGRKKPLYCVRLKGGHSYYATAEHQWPVIAGEIIQKYSTDALTPGMRLPIAGFMPLGFGTDGTRDEGFLAGWLTGDGNITLRSDTGKKQIGMIVSDEDYQHGIAQKLERILQGLGSSAKFNLRIRDDSRWYELHTQNDAINVWLGRIGLKSKQALPSSVWTNASEGFRAGFIDGLFSSDGSIDLKRQPGYVVVVLMTASASLARDVSDLLGFYGIRTTIDTSTHAASFPNGKDYHKEYTSHQVRINASEDVENFAKITRLSHTRKQQQLDTRTPHISDIRAHSAQIISVGLSELKEDVWDIAVDDETHCFQLAHCITGNCGEIILREFGFCNLSIAVARPNDTVETLLRKVELATYFGVLQSTCTNFGYLRPEWKKNCDEERLLGVDITGHADCPLLRAGATGRAALLRQLKEKVASTKKLLAKRLGINESACDTTVKPSGDSAVFFNCASGVKPWHSSHQIRWVRESIHSPVATFLKDEGVPCATAPEDESLLVFGFPMRAPDGATLRDDLSALDQLENWLEWKRNWAEHSVSCTIYVEPHEWLAVGHWVYEHFDEVNSIAFLPKDNGIYRYAPNEELTKDQYDAMVAKFPKLNWGKLVRYENDDQTTSAQAYACVADNCSI